jgi:hypothetical protein
LSGIRDQLEDEGIKRIRLVLEVAKSGYLQSFVKHASLIEVHDERGRARERKGERSRDREIER